MILYLIILGVLGLSVSSLPSVIGEASFLLISLFTAGYLFYHAGRGNKVYKGGLISSALGCFIIGIANIFWIYGGLQAEFPESTNFWGSMLLAFSYSPFLFALAHAFWNLHSNQKRLTVGFLAILLNFFIAALSLLAFIQGFVYNYEQAINLSSVFYAYFSGAMVFVALINLFYSSENRLVNTWLLVSTLGYFLGDLFYLFGPEDYSSIVWNMCLTVSFAALAIVAHLVRFGSYPNALLTGPSQKTFQSQAKAMQPLNPTRH